MDRIQIKSRARDLLGHRLFGETWIMAVLAVFIISAVSGAAGTVFVGIGAAVVSGILMYGLCYIFLKLNKDGEPIRLEHLFKGFQDDFVQVLLISLLSQLFILLWTLLFIIPGIVKSYAYSMVHYIKIDHPEYDWKQCLEQSQKMMKGNKAKLFFMDLSFLGWIIVGILCLGIGVLWVIPYMECSRAVFYENIKDSDESISF